MARHLILSHYQVSNRAYRRTLSPSLDFDIRHFQSNTEANITHFTQLATRATENTQRCDYRTKTTLASIPNVVAASFCCCAPGLGSQPGPRSQAALEEAVAGGQGHHHVVSLHVVRGCGVDAR